MKKSTKRILSLLLVLAMVLSLTTSVLAAQEMRYPKSDDHEGSFKFADAEKEGTKLLSFGDSVAVTWYDEGEEDDDYQGKCGNAADEDRYARTVADTLEIDQDNCTFIHRFGLRSSDVYIGLGGEKDETDLLYSMDDQPACEPDATSDWLQENSGMVIQAVQEADVILLEVGTSDVLFYAQELSGLEDFFEDIGSKSMDDITEFLQNYMQLTATGYKNFLKYYYASLQKIAEYKKPSSKVVLVSTLNLIKGMEIGDLSSMDVELDIPFPIGEIDTPIITLMNESIQNWADEFGFLYADITATPLGCNTGRSFEWDVPTGIEAMFGYPEICLATHPAFPEGYDYIARQILNAINEEKTTDRNFRINLAAGLDSQNISVTVDGVKTTKFTYDKATGILTIRNLLKNSALVRVKILDAEGKSTSLSSWYCKYTSGKGFSASLLYYTADLDSTTARITTLVKKLTSTIGSALKDALVSAGN